MDKRLNPRYISSPDITATVDPLADTQPTHLRESLADYQPIFLGASREVRPSSRRARWSLGCGCGLLVLAALVLLAIYTFFPLRTNIIVFGVDDRSEGGVLGRSDTLILLTFQPYKRYVGMLSIPRDLWVQVPGYGENRINTAHFFAEAAQPGSGPQAVKSVIQANFGVEVAYYVRARFDSFRQLVDAMGGVEITLSEPMGGYPAGRHHLNGDQALAFVRDRSGADDFSRMRKAQLVVRSLVMAALSPRNAPNWFHMAQIVLDTIETDVPLYMLPRLGVAYLWAGADGLDTRLIDREMVTPFLTDQGARVLLPRWELIRPLIIEMFGE